MNALIVDGVPPADLEVPARPRPTICGSSSPRTLQSSRQTDDGSFDSGKRRH